MFNWTFFLSVTLDQYCWLMHLFIWLLNIFVTFTNIFINNRLGLFSQLNLWRNFLSQIIFCHKLFLERWSKLVTLYPEMETLMCPTTAYCALVISLYLWTVLAPVPRAGVRHGYSGYIGGYIVLLWHGQSTIS